MTTEGPIHLTDQELALAARDSLEGPRAHHLEECDHCVLRMNELHGVKPRLGRSPTWLKDAAKQEFALISRDLAAAEETHRRGHARVAIDIRLVAAALGATVLMATAIVITVRPEQGADGPIARNDDGGVVGFKEPTSVASANLYCIEQDAHRHLMDSDSSCERGLKLELSVTVPVGTWRHLAVVVCTAERCELVQSRTLSDAGQVSFEFENRGAAGKRHGFLIFSDIELNSAHVHGASVEPRGDELALDFDTHQVPFDWSVSDGKQR